jgi:hypothetical protein
MHFDIANKLSSHLAQLRSKLVMTVVPNMIIRGYVSICKALGPELLWAHDSFTCHMPL